MSPSDERGGTFGPFLQGLLFAFSATLHLIFLAWLFPRQLLDTEYQALTALVFLVVYFLFRNHDWLSRWDIGRVGSMGTRVVVTWIGVCALVALLGFATKQTAQYSRLVLTLWMLTTPIVFFLVHGVMRYGLLRLFPDIAYSRTAVVVFVNPSARRLADVVNNLERPRYEVLGFFEDRTAERVGGLPANLPILGKIDQLREFVNTHNVEVVFVVLPAQGADRTDKVLQQLDDTTASIYYVPDFNVFDLAHLRFASVGGMPVIRLTETPFFGADGLLKRALDVTLSLTALFICAPLFLIVAVAVLVTMGWPIFFTQRRYGLNGEEIRVHKFRSMHNTDDGEIISQATRDDPRVTPLGRFLRRTSIDEWPQFWNVLKGEMSMVGPRPHAVAHNEEYRKLIRRYMVRHKVKPGLTGWAQVSGLRGETLDVQDMEQRIQYDLDYIRNWSLELDIRIVLKTIWIIFRDREAY